MALRADAAASSSNSRPESGSLVMNMLETALSDVEGVGMLSHEWRIGEKEAYPALTNERVRVETTSWTPACSESCDGPKSGDSFKSNRTTVDSWSSISPGDSFKSNRSRAADKATAPSAGQSKSVLGCCSTSSAAPDSVVRREQEQRTNSSDTEADIS